MWDKRRSFRIGRAEILQGQKTKFIVGRAEMLGTKDEVLVLVEQRYEGQKMMF